MNMNNNNQKDTYKCPLCGETHTRLQICPTVNEKLMKMGKNEKRRCVLANAVLISNEKGLDLIQILKEILYINTYYENEINVHILDIDFNIHYLAYSLGCKVKDLLRPSSEILPEFLNWIQPSGNCSVVINATTKKICGYDMEMHSYLEVGTSFPHRDALSIYINKEKHGSKWSYQLCMNCQVFAKTLSSDTKNDLVRFDAFGYEGSTGIVIADDKNGLLEDMFESNFDFTEVAEGKDFKDPLLFRLY